MSFSFAEHYFTNMDLIGDEAEYTTRLGVKKKRSPTHQAPSRCCPKTTTAIRTSNITQTGINCKACEVSHD